MSGNRDELPEPTDGPEGSSRSQQRRARDEIAEELGIDPSLVATRDTIDRGIERRLTGDGQQAAERTAAQRVAEQAGFIQRDDVSAEVDPETFAVDRQLTDEGTTEAEQRLAEQTAADQEFVRPSDLQANVDPETFIAEASLTEEGRQNAQQRQAEQLRQQAAQQSDRFGESDFRVDRSGEEIAVEPTESAVDRERREAAADQFEGQSQFINDVEPADVTLTDDSAELADSIIDRAEQRAERQARQQASQQRQQARRDFAQSIESGSAFGDLPDGVDPSSLVGNVDPQDDIVREGDSLTLAADVQSQINSRLESDALQQQRRNFAAALESGEAFEDGEAPDALGSVDPQTDIEIDDGQLTLADDTRTELIETQIREQAGGVPGLNTEGVLQRAASQDEILQAVEERIESQTGTDVRPGLIEDANLTVNPDGTITSDRVLLNSRRFDDFRDVSTLRAQSDVLDGANLSVDAAEEFNNVVEQSIAEQISERNVVDVSPDQIDISGGSVDVATPSSLTIENDQITADGLTAEGQDDFARRQLQSIETTEGISVATPIDSQPFANVSARLAEAAEGGGSLSSATRIVAASETVDNIGDLDDMADTRIIAGLEPQQAEERLGIDADTVEEAQRDIRVNQIELNNDPEAVLQDIAANQDEFVNDSTRIGVAGERGQRIRQAARSQLNELEQSIAAGDDSVSPGDVNLSLTDDLSGIRSVNQAGRQAIAEQVDEQLPNFGAEEINVNVSDGEINTSIEDSVRERFIENAQRVQEIQVRNEIADQTEAIDRREIQVDDGNVGLSEEGVEQLRIDAVDNEVGEGEITADLNAQTPGVDLSVADLNLEQRGGGIAVGINDTARTRINSRPDSLSSIAADATSVDTTVENQSPEISDPIRALEGGLRDVGESIQPGLASVGRGAGDALATASVLPTVEQGLTGTNNIEQFFESAGEGAARAVNPGLIAADVTGIADRTIRGPNRDFGVEDLLGAQEGAAISAGANIDEEEELTEAQQSLSVTPEQFIADTGEQRATQLQESFEANPVETSGQLAGGVFAGTVAGTAASRAAFRVGRADLDTDARVDNRPALGSGGRGTLLDADTIDEFRAGNRGQLDLTGRQRGRDATEPEINDERLSQNLRQQTIARRQRELREATEGGTFEGVDDPIEGIGERARRAADDVELRDRTADVADDVRAGLTPEGGAVGASLSSQTPEVAFDDSIGSVEPGGEVADTVDTGVDAGIDGQFRQEIGTTGEQRFFERGRNDVVTGEDIDSQLGADVGAEPGVDVGARPGADVDAAPREGVDTGVGVSPRTGIDTDQRQDTRLNNRQDTDVGTPRVTGREINANREVGAPRSTDIDIPRFGTPDTPRPDVPETPEAEDPDEEQAFGLQSTDDLFDSEILSGEEALQQTFGSDGDRDGRFTL